MRRTAITLLAALAWGLAPVPASAAATPLCAGIPATITGTPGNDVIRGTAGDDVIVALAGNDVVRPGPGDDVVCGGPGNDYLTSHRGADLLLGGGQGDRIEGLGPEPTRIHGGAGPDFIFLAVTDAPGYVLDGGGGDDIGDVRLQLDAAVGGPALVIRRGPQTFSRAGVVTGAYAGIERLGLDERLAYEYYGTRAPDVVTVSDGFLPFVAKTYLGPDVVTGAEGDDVIDAGRGVDRVVGGPGTDVCLHAELARECESVSP